MASASKKLPVLKIECSSCPNKVETDLAQASEDGRDYWCIWRCAAEKNKKLMEYAYWKNNEWCWKPTTPHWCPLHKSTETSREHAFLVTLDEIYLSGDRFPLSEEQRRIFSSESHALEALIEEYKKFANRLDQKDKESKLAIFDDITKISTVSDFQTAVSQVGWFSFSIKEIYINEGF